MKRGKPLSRGKGLKRGKVLGSDPDKTRDWQNRSRKPLSPGTPKVRTPIPTATRAVVYKRSRGKCIMCPSRIDHVHHVLPVQSHPKWDTEVLNLVGLCAPCHDEHERWHRRIPLASLPIEVRLFAQNAGPQEAIYLHRNYPGNYS